MIAIYWNSGKLLYIKIEVIGNELSEHNNFELVPFITYAETDFLSNSRKWVVQIMDVSSLKVSISLERKIMR